MAKAREILYVVCRKVDECIDYIVSGLSKLAREYKRRRDNVGKILHWKLARKCLKLEINGMNISQKVF